MWEALQSWPGAAALRAARETGLPATVGFVCAAADDSVPRLLSGESLGEALVAVVPLGPEVVFANCAPPPVILAALRELRELTDLATGGYANIGHVDDVVGWSPDDTITGERYAAYAAEWLDLGARVIGGCCGTRPEHTAALRGMLDAVTGD